MKLHDLRPADGSRQPRTRVGRGIAAGKGKTAGRGTKGQKARAGGSIPPWFEGGQTPLHMRIPKLRGFKNRFKIDYEVVNVGAIGALAERGAFEVETPAKGAKAGPVTINQDILRAVGLVRTLNKPLKILGAGELSAALFVVADAFTASARTKIEAAGGSVNVLEIPTSPLAALGVDDDETRTAREPRSAAGRAAADKEAGARVAREAVTAEVVAQATAAAEEKAAKPTRAAKVQPAATADASDAPEESADAGAPLDAETASGVVAFRAPDIRRRVLYVLALLIVFRLLAAVPVPGINRDTLREFIEGNALIGLLNLFSGGGLSNFSVVAVGMNPYINASIIMQLMTGVVPRLQALSREGEFGRNKINQYTRYLTVPMAILQSYGFLALLNSQDVLTGSFDLASFTTLTQIATLTAGAIALMWIGELITERGIGNGISFIIFAGIVSQAPGAIGAFLINPNITILVAFGAVAIAAVAVIIYIQEGQRRIPIQYASRVRGRRMYSGGQTFLPLRVNQAGVIPIIFAISILLFPQQLASYFTTSEITIVADIARGIVTFFSPTSIIYIVLYFLLTMGFTYFYTAFTFKPDETAEQLRKNGGFIPGIRPGRPTQDYLARVVSRITFAGALFLATVAVAPQVVALGVPDLGALGLGGTSLLIVVSVVVETMKQIEAQLMMRNYEGFIR